jgi:hypothetical protein
MKKMSQFKSTLILILLLAVASFGQSQNCYEVIADMSGFDTSPYQAELETAACELKNAFPSEFQDQFRVYDFGFYSQNEFTQGGFQAVWDKVIAEIPTQYYLIFGKQTDRTGIYTKFWFDLKLPNTGNFECIDLIAPGYRSSLSKKIEVTVQSTYEKSGKSPFTYSNAEIAAIDTLKHFVTNIISCCDPNLRSSGGCNTCLFTGQEVVDYLELNDYIKFPITIDQSNKLESLDCGVNSSALREKENPNYKRSVNSIVNYLDYDITIDGQGVNLESLVSSTMPSGGFGNFIVHIMDFDNIINSTFYEAEDEVRAAKGGLIYFVDNYSEISHLYISPTSFDINLHLEQSYLEDIYNSSISSNQCEGCPDWMLEIWDSDFNSNEGSITATYVVPAVPLAAVDGPVLIVDAIIAAAATAAATYDLTQRVYLTYIAHNPNLNAYYCGRTSGFGTPQSILASRIKVHHAVTLGFTVDVDRTMQVYPYAYWCIRGREQQNIDFYGGAISDSERRPNATCVNSIRGVAKYNPFGYLYHWSSNSAWGEKYPYTGYGEEDIEYLWNKLKELQRMKKWLKF